MEVGVRNGLAGNGPAICTHVESFDLGILFTDPSAQQLKELIRLGPFFLRHGEQVAGMSPGDHERVMPRNRCLILHREYELALLNRAIPKRLRTERARLVTLELGNAKVARIPVALGPIAAAAKHLKVRLLRLAPRERGTMWSTSKGRSLAVAPQRAQRRSESASNWKRRE
jgi:hypothetical protein